MSLLLDALKRAEQEKIARQGHEPSAASPAGAEAGGAPGVETPARRKLELEPHEPPLSSATSPAPVPATAKREREGARAVFAAKQAEPAAPASGSGKVVLAVVAAALVVLAGGGAYVWYEISRTPGPMARGPIPAAPRPVTPAAPAATPPATVTAPPPAETKAAVPPVAVLKPESAATTPARGKPQTKAAEQLVMTLLKQSADAKPAPPLKLSRTIEAPRVSPQVAQGYDALRNGDPAAARRASGRRRLDPAHAQPGDRHAGGAGQRQRRGEEQCRALRQAPSLHLLRADRRGADLRGDDLRPQFGGGAAQDQRRPVRGRARREVHRHQTVCQPL